MKAYLNHFAIVMAFTAIMGSCNKDNSTTSGGSNSTDSTNPDAIDVTACATATGINKIICLADAFKGQLNASQLAAVQLSYSITDAIKWSNLPQALVRSPYQRLGLNFGSMTTTQIQYAKALLKEIASATANEGYDEMQQIINADEYLNANGGGSDYGRLIIILLF